MSIIDNSLKYLRESLSNYIEDDTTCQQICMKLESGNYESEDAFVDDLEDEEIKYLDLLLKNEINYARRVQDEVRVKELNDIYELLL